MEKPQTKSSLILNYFWSILMIICIGLLTAHLVLSVKTTNEKNDQLIEKTFTISK